MNREINPLNYVGSEAFVAPHWILVSGKIRARWCRFNGHGFHAIVPRWVYLQLVHIATCCTSHAPQDLVCSTETISNSILRLLPTTFSFGAQRHVSSSTFPNVHSMILLVCWVAHHNTFDVSGENYPMTPTVKPSQQQHHPSNDAFDKRSAKLIDCNCTALNQHEKLPNPTQPNNDNTEHDLLEVPCPFTRHPYHGYRRISVGA